MAAESRILPTSGAGFGASDNRLHRGAIPELAAVFPPSARFAKDARQARSRRDLWPCPAGRPILLHNSVGPGTRVLRRAPFLHQENATGTGSALPRLQQHR